MKVSDVFDRLYKDKWEVIPFKETFNQALKKFELVIGDITIDFVIRIDIRSKKGGHINTNKRIVNKIISTIRKLSRNNKISHSCHQNRKIKGGKE